MLSPLELEEKRLKIESLKNELAALDAEQQALKILANAGYGSIGNSYFRYFRVENAEAITKTGQFVIRFIEIELNRVLDKFFESTKDRVIISDTDSVVLELSDLFTKSTISMSRDERIDILDLFAKQTLQPIIGRIINTIVTTLNAFPDVLSMKREIIADKTIVQSKKHYIMNVFDNKGVRYKTAKKKIIGMEAVRSSTPSWCKDRIKQALDIMFVSNNKECLQFIDQCQTDYWQELNLSIISFPRGLPDLELYTEQQKSLPIHVAAALAFNRFIRDTGLTKKYTPIRSGEKIKFCYLLNPNPFKSHVIGWNTTAAPKELNLEMYIDRQHNFYVGFLKPIQTLMEIVGWSTSRCESVSMNDLF